MIGTPWSDTTRNPSTRLPSVWPLQSDSRTTRYPQSITNRATKNSPIPDTEPSETRIDTRTAATSSAVVVAMSIR